MGQKKFSLGELQARLIYAMIVAGKSAKFADVVTKRVMSWCYESEFPFEMLNRLISNNTLLNKLMEARTGNYQKLLVGFMQLTAAAPDLRTCTPANLEKIHGIGPKTSRFFILWTRPGYRCAALDRHILRWLYDQGYDVPKSTPPAGKRYEEIEKFFLNEADGQGKTPRKLDLEIWEAARL